MRYDLPELLNLPESPEVKLVMIEVLRLKGQPRTVEDLAVRLDLTADQVIFASKAMKRADLGFRDAQGRVCLLQGTPWARALDRPGAKPTPPAPSPAPSDPEEPPEPPGNDAPHPAKKDAPRQNEAPESTPEPARSAKKPLTKKPKTKRKTRRRAAGEEAGE